MFADAKLYSKYLHLLQTQRETVGGGYSTIDYTKFMFMYVF